MSEAFKQIQTFAEKEFRDHVLTVRLDQSGPFRSYRCQRPGSWCYGFDVTFVPGWVYLSGDIGHLALSREVDMLPWLRGVLTRGTIDLRYVAEKSPQSITNRAWSEWGAKRMLDRIFESYEISDVDQAELRAMTTDQHDWGAFVIPKLLDLEVYEFYEFGDASDWDSNYCWCVLGLKWCVEAIDNHNTEKNGE